MEVQAALNTEKSKTRNLYTNYWTENKQIQKQPLNSKFNDRRQQSINKGKDDSSLLLNGEMSVLFSEVINKTTNQMTSTCEEVAHPSQDAPQPPHLIINMNSKPVAESLEPSDIAVTITSNPYINHASQKSEGSRHNKFHSNKFQVTKGTKALCEILEITSKLRMQEREQRKSFNNTKIRMNNSFMLRMENRKTHGNIINSNIRPLSAGIMSKMSNQKM